MPEWLIPVSNTMFSMALCWYLVVRVEAVLNRCVNLLEKVESKKSCWEVAYGRNKSD